MTKLTIGSLVVLVSMKSIVVELMLKDFLCIDSSFKWFLPDMQKEWNTKKHRFL
jgi:hypothetical protein